MAFFQNIVDFPFWRKVEFKRSLCKMPMIGMRRAPFSSEWVVGSQARRGKLILDPILHELIQKARTVQMTESEKQAQRISFAYGNTHFENADITRDTVRRASEKMFLQNAKADPA